MTTRPVTLTDLAKGALMERFHFDQQKILENIHDPNTPVKAKRKLRIEFTYTPTGGRTGDDRGEVLLDVTTKVQLCEDKGISTLIHSGRVASGEVVALEYTPQQLGLDGIGAPEPAQPAPPAEAREGDE